MERSKDAFGCCPRCDTSGWHRYKGKALIFGNTRKFKVSLYKCRKCGKKFGFDLSDPIPKPKIKYNDLYDISKKKQEEKDEFDAMLEALSEDYDKDFTITPDEVSKLLNSLECLALDIDSVSDNDNVVKRMLIQVKRISDILGQVTSRG